MESSKLTDEELIELAKKEQEEHDNDRLDVGYYQDVHIIKDGTYTVITTHLYDHYRKWSVDPISLEIFIDMLQLQYKNDRFLLIDKELCNINLEQMIGDYVKKERKRQKEERLREISSIKSQAKR